MNATKKQLRFITNFWKRIAKQPDGCWYWLGCTNKRGYGQLKFDGKNLLAHRVAYQLVFGEVPQHTLVCHKCDNPPCCNPDHLFLGTSADNTNDKLLKQRQAKGEKHGNAKLTCNDVRRIRLLHATGNFTQLELANRFNIARSKIGAVVNLEIWKDCDDYSKIS